ncbi:MAG TPA: dockerin type I repeat-containing protein [Patescibacteria group bacterium]
MARRSIIQVCLLLAFFLSGFVPNVSATVLNSQQTLTITATVPGSSGGSGAGGGGGGGGGTDNTVPTYYPTATVLFSGKAYPNSTVVLLKDALVASTTVADHNANFSFILNGVSTGNYLFSAYSQDVAGRKSTLFTFPVNVTAGTSVNVGGVFIAPTIDTDKQEVKKGELLRIYGQSVPNSTVTVLIPSARDFSAKVQADTKGNYNYNFDTMLSDPGTYIAKAKAAVSDAISPVGQSVAFTVSDKNVFKPRSPLGGKIKGDINGDGKVNLLDFSIMAYWYGRKNPPPEIDFDGDGKVDLVDFSIMAFNWSG